MKEYYGITKRPWDEMWHALYEKKDKISYDRVTKKEALKIANEIGGIKDGRMPGGTEEGFGGDEVDAQANLDSGGIESSIL